MADGNQASSAKVADVHLAAQGDKGIPKTSSSKLEDQAATAALYVTKNQTKSASKPTWLDSNNKLSSAGAAASLRYATAKDLPSYPSSGLPPNASAAGAAASLGWANQKPFEHWKPDPSSAASTAALIAKDYKMDPLWQPQQSANGAKAAILAHRDGAKVEIWKPEPSAWGNSAALLAVQGKKGTPSSQLDHGHTDLGNNGSLLAATGAMAVSRKRALSSPIVAAETYPDQANAVANALNAATVAHKPSASRYSAAGTNTALTNMPREMYTSNPPIGPELEEKQRAGVLRASAVAMAQKMYTIQQKKIDSAAQDAEQAATSAHRRRSITSMDEEVVSPMRFNNLQDAAQELAKKRLSKLHDEHHQAREYREYYGDSKKSSVAKRLSMGLSSPRGRTRGRASSEGARDEDVEQSQKIRAQMSLFTSSLSQITAKKRQEDREALIAIAQRNVAKSLHGMDEQVFQETGRIAPSLKNEWEVKARAAAQARSGDRMVNHGKVNIGGGKFVNQSEIDQVAARNVQPALDEINDKAAAEHARQLQLKADQDAKKREEESKKHREKEEKEAEKKVKQQEKAARDEEKRLAKQEKRKSKGRSFFSKSQLDGPATATQATAAVEPVAAAPIAAERVAAEPVVTAPIATEPAVATELVIDAEPIAIAADEPTVTNTGLPLDTEEPPATPLTGVLTPFAAIPTPDKALPSTQEMTPPVQETIPPRFAPIPLGEETNSPVQEVIPASQETYAVPKSGSPKSGGRVRSWFKTTFASVPHSNTRRMSKSQQPEAEPFVGGAALTGASPHNSLNNVTKTAEPHHAVPPTTGAGAEAVGGVRDPTAHGLGTAEVKEKEAAEEARIGRSQKRPESISTASLTGGRAGEEVEEAKDNFDEGLAPPPPVLENRTGAISPHRETKFHEEIS